MSYTYAYPRPMVTVDILLFDTHQAETEILLIQRLNNPYKNYWALPGGFVDENEALITAANRELKEETHIEAVNLTQFYTFGDPGRDPRGHCISVAYYAFINKNQVNLKADDDAKNAAWFKITRLPNVAFDHKIIIDQATNTLW